MKTVLRGSVLTVGNNIDTDMIVPGRYLELTDPKETIRIEARSGRGSVVADMRLIVV